MEHPIITHFSKQLTLTEAERAYLQANVTIQHYASGTSLLTAGSISTAFYFVVVGCVRMYYLVDGVEKTTFFYQAGQFVSSYESFTQQIPAKHYLEVVTATQLAVFDLPTVTDILQQHPRFDILARMAMEEELSILQQMIASFVTLTPEQRYLQLLREQPELLQLVPQYHIATYLGVSPETLSRIKKRLTEKGIF